MAQAFMLPDLVRQPYVEFEQQLQRLQTLVTQANPDIGDIQAGFLETQHCFQMRIVPADSGSLPPVDAGRLQAIHTEMHKQLRLLATDMIFLQAARQPLTRQQRQGQMGDRVLLLYRYCQAVLQEGKPNSDGENVPPMV